MSHRSCFPPVYPNLTNPNSDASKESFRVSSFRVPQDDARLIISVVANSSIITHICQNAIKHAAEYCRVNNLTLADYDRFVEYVRERSTFATPPAQGSAPDDPGRGKGGNKQTQKPADKRTQSRKGTA